VALSDSTYHSTFTSGTFYHLPPPKDPPPKPPSTPTKTQSTEDVEDEEDKAKQTETVKNI